MELVGRMADEDQPAIVLAAAFIDPTLEQPVIAAKVGAPAPAVPAKAIATLPAPGGQAPAGSQGKAAGKGNVRMPTIEECRNFEDIGEVLVHVGLMNDDERNLGQFGPQAASFLVCLGADVTAGLVELGENPVSELEAALATWQVPNAEGIGGPPSLTQKGRARLFFRIVRAVADSYDPAKATPVTPASSGGAAAGTSAPVVFSNQVPLKEVTSQVAEGTCSRMTKDEILECFAQYEVQYGKNKRPPRDEEPPEEQLSALKHLLHSGDCPYVEFTMWSPHGHRLAKKMKLTGQVFNNRGELHTVELAGPATFELWLASWNILQHGFLMHRAVDLGNLLEYRRYMERFYSKFGENTWALQYQADVRTRLEHFPRTNRRGYAEWKEAQMAGKNHDYDPSRPWNWVFAAVVKDKDWWKEELEDLATQIVRAQPRVMDVLGGDAPVQKRPHHSDLPGVDHVYHVPTPDVWGWTNGPPAPPPPPGGGERERVTENRPPRRPKNLKLHNVVDGFYVTSRQGTPLCLAYNQGTCDAAVNGHVCPRDSGKTHLCSRCLSGDHNGTQCRHTSATSGPKRPGKGDGKGGMKGDGKGWGKRKGGGKRYAPYPQY